MTVFMKKIILILSVLLPLAVSCGAPKENPMLEELDGVLKDKAGIQLEDGDDAGKQRVHPQAVGSHHIAVEGVAGKMGV